MIFYKKRTAQLGSTLIEVLIAVLVLSIGLVGALKLQTEGVRLNADSRYSVLASTYAQDALDAITFNRVGEKSAWVSVSCTTDASSLVGKPKDWLTRLKADLPAGCATIGCSNSNNSCSVEIEWTPPGREEVKATYVIYN